jgi:hypothetical protein
LPMQSCSPARSSDLTPCRATVRRPSPRANKVPLGTICAYGRTFGFPPPKRSGSVHRSESGYHASGFTWSPASRSSYVGQRGRASAQRSTDYHSRPGFYQSKCDCFSRREQQVLQNRAGTEPDSFAPARSVPAYLDAENRNDAAKNGLFGRKRRFRS